ncbi:hypothetical protein [Thioalkalivibrio sp. HK1]|uniref:hypothetical protein n=1 Tax=Thioalkalivibrio sp. HK1 TaxID=1469245 RepID=UPI00046EAA7F|nr:hypothetical protein [Thioalkalivibrio sp. HK1]
MSNAMILLLVAIALGIFILQLWLVLTLLSSVRRIDGSLAKLMQRGGLPVLRRPPKEEGDG